MAQRRIRIPTYMKNVARSFGYAISDTFSEYNPVIKSITKETKDSASEIYDSIKSISFNKDSIDGSLIGTAKNTVNDAWNNLKDDLKTGNWYNKQRQEAADNDLMKAMGFDFDLDFDFDDDWGDFDDDEDSDTQSAKMEMANDARNTGAVISAVDNVGYKLSTSINNATVESASYIVNSSNRASRALYNLNERGFTSVNKSLGALNNTIASFAQIAQPLSTHMQNSALFFTKTTESLNKMEQSLEQIVKNTTPATVVNNQRSNGSRGKGFTDLFDSDGIFSIENYKDMIKENFKGEKDLLDMGLGFIKKMGSNGSVGKNFSPMMFATQFMTNVMLPKAFKESMKQFNESLKYGMMGGMAKLKNFSPNNIVLSLLMDYIIPKDDLKNKIDVSKYNKGAVAWDGIARKALTEVIPTTLLKIYSALTDTEEMVYDYDRGRFVKSSQAKFAIDNKRKEAAKNAGGKFYQDAMKEANDDKVVEKEIESYFLKAFLSGDTKYMNIMKDMSASEMKQLGLSDRSIKVLRNLITKYRLNDKSSGKEIAKAYTGNIRVQKEIENAIDKNHITYNQLKDMSDNELRGIGLSKEAIRSLRSRSMLNGTKAHNDYIYNKAAERSRFSREMSDLEARGDSVEGFFQNGFTGGSNKLAIGGGLSKAYEQASITLLEGIYKFTGFMADNIKYLRGEASKVNYSIYKRRIRGRVSGSFTGNLGGGEKSKSDAHKGSNSKNSSKTQDYTKILSEEEQAEKEHKEKLEEAGKQGKGIIAKIKKFFVGSGDSDSVGLLQLYQKPFESVSILLNKMTSSIDKLLWGDDTAKGIFGDFIDTAKKKFEDLWNKLDEKFGIKKGIEKAKDFVFGKVNQDTGEREGGLVGDTRDYLKEKSSKVASSVGNTVKQFFGSGKTDNGTAAHGRKVTKSGIVSVSEGELIVPAELNPFYHGTVNKSSQISKEIRNTKNFYGMYADGGTVGEGKGHKFIREGFTTLGNGASELFNSLFGSGNKKEADKDKNIISAMLKKTFGAAKENKGAVGAGALLGAGASLLTGAVVGPLFGAAIGSAVALTANSKEVQKLLFGEDILDDEGKVTGKTGGLFNKKISTFITKHVPSMGKGAAIGGAAGLFLGSPLLGAVVGSTVAYAKNSDNFKNWLFGNIEYDKDGNPTGRSGGLISKDLQEKVKKASPNIAAGAIAGLVAGPFGIVGNLVVGAGMGYLTTSQKFHNYIFGDPANPKDKGLVGILKDKVFDNLDSLFHNMFNAINGWGKSLIRGTSRRLKDFFTGKARAFENGEAQGPLGKLIGGVASLGGKAIKGATNLTGDIIGGINNKVVKDNLRRGYDVYGTTEERYFNEETGQMETRKVKKNLNAAERAKLRDEKGMKRGTFRNFDAKILSQAASVDELNDLQQVLEDAKDPRRTYKRANNKILTGLYSDIKDLDPKTAKQVAKMVTKGDLSGLSSILSSEEYEKYKGVIEKAKTDNDAAKAGKGKSQEVLSKLKALGINLDNPEKLDKALDLIKAEKSDGRFTPEEQAKKKEEDWRDRVLRIFRNIDANLAAKLGGSPAEDANGKPNNLKRVFDEANKPQGIQNVLNNISGNADDEENVKYVTDMLGNTHKQRLNNQGEPVEDTQDKETIKARAQMNKALEGFTAMGTLGAAATGIKGFFGKFFKNKDDKKEKKNIFEKIFEMLSGSGDGPLKILANLFSGNGALAPITNIAKNMSLKTVIGAVGIPALFAGAISGAFDGIWAKISSKIPALQGNETSGNASMDNNSSVTVTTSDGKKIEVQSDNSGTPKLDADGNYIKLDGSVVASSNIKDINYASANTSLSHQLKKNAVNGLIMGHGSVLTKVASNANKSWGKLLGKNSGKLVDAGLKNGIMASIAKLLEKIPDIISKIPFISKFADKSDTIVTALYTHLDDAVTKLGSKAGAIATKLSNLCVILKVAYVVHSGINAWGDAESILGITENATFGQRVVATLLAVVNALIPVIGDLIPNKTLVNIFMDVAPKLGIDVSDLQNQRDRAKQEVEDYNNQNGTSYTIEEYNQVVQNKAGTLTRIKNYAKDTWHDTKTKASNMVNGIKEKGLGGYAKEQFANMGNTFMEQYQQEGGGISGVFAGIGANLQNMLPGIFGEIAAKNAEILKLATKGDIKGLWSVELDSLSKKNEANPERTGADIFSRIVGQVPLIFTKGASTLLGVFCAIGNKIKDFLGFSKDDNLISTAGQVVNGAKDLFKLAIDGKVKEFFTFSMDKGDDESGIASFIKNIPIHVMKIPTAIVAVVSGVGHAIYNGVKKIVDKVKETGNIVKEEYEYGQKLVYDKDSDLKQMFQFPDEDPENPISGFGKVLRITSRFVAVPIAITKKIGNSIKEGFSKIVNGAKASFKNLVTNQANISGKVRSGDVQGLWDLDYTETEDNPLGGINKGIFTVAKIINMPTAGIFWIGGKIKEAFNAVISGAKIAIKNTYSNYALVKEKADAGDVQGLWDLDYQEDEDNPIGGISKAIFTVSRVLSTPITAVRWVGNKIKEGFNTVVDGAKIAIKNTYSNYALVKEKADAGDLEGLWDLDYEEDEDNPIGGISKGIFTVSRVLSTPITAVRWVGNKIFDGIKGIVDYVKGNITLYRDANEKLASYAKDGDIGAIWSEKLDLKEDDPLKAVWNVGFTISKVINTVIGAIDLLIKPIKNAIGGIVDGAQWVGEKVGDAADWVGDKVSDAGDWIGDRANDVADFASDAWNGLTGWIGGRSGLSRYSGGASKFVSQNDKRYANMRIGNSTVAQNGCAPAVASMVSGGKLSMNDAVNAAQGYQNYNGTTANYFGDVLGQSGIGTKRISNSNVMRSVANGNQVILMGRDAKNTSKANSPFGPNNHYVVASGVDNKGNLIVKDPEARGTKKYSPKILKNTSLALSTFSGGTASNIAGSAYSTAPSTSKSSVAGSAYATTPKASNRDQTNWKDVRYENLGSFTMPTEEQFNAFIKSQKSDSPFVGKAKVFLDAARQSGLDPRYILAHAAVESAWGTSRISQDKSNYFGIGAFDATPYSSAYSFDPGLAGGIIGGANWIAKNYYHGKNRNGSGQTSVYTMRWNNNVHQYATDPQWDSTIAKIMASANKAMPNNKAIYDESTASQMDESAIVGGINGGSYGLTSPTTSDDSSPASSSNSGGIISIISSIFSNALGKVFGIGGSDTGAVAGVSGPAMSGGISNDANLEYATDAITGPGNATQKKIAAKMLSVQGKLKYDMSGPRNPDKGSADCSSTVNWAYKTITGKDIGNNTGAILSNTNTEVVDMASNMDATSGGTNSSGPKLDKLMPGDIMLYSRPSGSYTAGRKYRVGHVEMYLGDGKRIGHGGPDAGPKVSEATKDSGRYIMAKRLKGITDADKSSIAGSAYSVAAAGSGLPVSNAGRTLWRANPSANVYGGSIDTITVPQKYKPLNLYSGGDSGMVSNIKENASSILNQVRNKLTSEAKSGTISSEIVEKLLSSIIKILETISNNTASVDKIYEALAAYINGKSKSEIDNTLSKIKEDQPTDIDPGIKDLVGSLAAIAKG